MPITSRSQLDELNEALRLLYLLFISSDDYQCVVDEANKVLDGPMAPLLRRNWRERWQIESSYKRFDAKKDPLRLYPSQFQCKLLRDDYCDVLFDVANLLVRLVEDATTPHRLREFTKDAAKEMADYLGLVEISIPPVDVLNLDPAKVTTPPPDPSNRYENLDQLQNAHRKAWLSFAYAEAKKETRLEDRDAFDWLEENGIEPAEAGSELVDYQLPAFDTWSRYLREARKVLGEQKYTPRHALRKDRRGTKSVSQQGTRKVSRSIVRSDEIDRQQPTEVDGD